MGVSVFLFVTILWVQGWAEIHVPGQNVDKNTLTTLGIKTIDWQGGDDANSTNSQVQVHHNYSKVYLQREKFGDQGQQVDEFGQTAVSDEFSPQTSFGGQEQDALNLDDFSQFSDGDDNAFQLEVSSQLNQGRDLNSLIDKATFQGQTTDDLNLPQTVEGIPQYQTSVSTQYSKSFGQGEGLVTSSSSPIYNAHSYGNSQRLDEIIEAEKGQHFEEFPEYDQIAEATSNEAQARQVKKFYILEKPIYVHGFKYPPDPEHSLSGGPEPEVHAKCPKMATGQFVYSLSCNQFLNCWKGRGHVQNCAPGTMFNPQTLECDFASKVKCLTGPRKPEREQERNLGSLKLKTGCPGEFSGVVPHHSDCSKFINCANGLENVMDCPPGTLFSLKINSCDFPYKAECASWSVDFGGVNGYGKYGNGNAWINQQQQNSENNGYNQEYFSGNKFGQYGQSSTNFGNGYGANSHVGTQQYLQGSQQNSFGQTGHTNLEQHSQVDSVGQNQQSSYYTGSSSIYDQNQDTFAGTHNSFGQAEGTSQSQLASIGNKGSVSCPVGATGLIPHPYDCSKFLDCAHSRTTIRQCTPGTAFNPNSNTCSVAYEQLCRTNSYNQYNQEQHQSSSSNGLQYGSYGQDDLTASQSQYLHGQQHIQSQNQGYYNQYTESAGSGGTVKCPDDALGLIAHPYDCSKFLNCAHGQTSVENCGPGTVFNPNSKVCDFPHKVDCSSTKPLSHSQFVQGNGANAAQWETSQSGKYYGQAQTSSQSSGSQQKSSSSLVKCPEYANGLYPHPTICSKFLNCANGQTFIQDCGPGTVFNPSSKVCDFPYNVECGASHGEGLMDIKNIPVSPMPETIASGSEQSFHGSGSNNQQSSDGQGQVTGWGTNNNHQGQQSGYGSSGSTQQQNHGQEQATGLNTGSQKQGFYEQGNNFLQNANREGYYGQNQQGSYGQGHSNSGGYQQGLYGQGQTTGSSSVGKNQQEGGYQQGFYAQGQSTGSSSANKNQQGFYGETQNTGSSSVGKNQQEGGYQQGLHGQGQSTGSSSVSKHQQEGGYQQGLYGQGQSTGSSSVGKHQQEGGYQQGLYGQGQSTGSSSAGKNQQEGGYQQGLYGQGQSTGSSSVSKHQQEGGYQQGLHEQGQSTGSSSVGKHQQEGGYQQGLYGQTQSTGSSHVSTNQHQGLQGQHQQGYYGQGQGNGGDQQFDETRNYNQIYGTSSKHNQIVPGYLRPHHASSPFPSTDVNADYEFGNEDGSLRPGTFKPVTVKPQPANNRKRKDFCEPLDFHCSVDDCIPHSMVCDGVKDCASGVDEQTCDKHLQAFTVTPNSILAVREKDKFLNISLVYCAKSCMEARSFECKSFSYRKDDGACFLSDTNVGHSGALVVSHPYNYYELKAFSVNCTGLYKCPSQKCIQHKQLCDGINDCGDRIDEKGCDAKVFGYEIRIGGTDKKHEGRIELKAFGKWGFICDDKFGLRDADVVCRELGFQLGALEVKGNSLYAQDVDDKDVFYLMDDVTCLGNETTVRDCDFNGWGVHNCEAQEVVGVTCKTPQENCPKDHWKCDSVQECLPIAFVCDGVFDCTDQSDEGSQHCEAPSELRLAGGSSKHEGRVEIRHHGIWGTVCDDDFNDDAAKVVCKYLGFPGRATAKKDGYFGPGSGPIWLDQVFCQGNESALQFCVHWNWGEHNCEHEEDVGVVCSNTKDDLGVVGSERHVQIHERKNIGDVLPEYLFPERCGLRKDDIFLEEDDVHFRVVKGSIAPKGDYPWQASLRIKNKSKPAHWCGAVVIAQKFVLTAAHCLIGFSKGAYFVVAGDYNTDEVEGTEQEVYIDEFYIHDQFRAGHKMNNDIALVKLKGDGFVFTKDVQPICLPDADIEYKNGMNCTISGFGTIQSGVSAYSHQMRAGWIPLQSRAVCQMPHVYGTAMTDGMICAGSLDEGVDACDGDSGGPLACLHEGFFTLYGLTSWGQHCGHANKPGVYVKVAYYRKWIDDTLRKNS